MRAVRVWLAALAFLTAGAAADAQEVTVLAAASLTDVMRALGKAWAAKGHAAPRFVFAASSTLARQIEQGAPADIFISADEQWADYLQQRHLLLDGSRRSVLGNTLVLVAPADQPGDKPGDVTVSSARLATDIAARLGPQGRLAVGDPNSVPAGIYAKEALTKLGLWDSLAPHLAPSESVRAALLLVERGETPLGIVYATDAAVDKGVRIVGVFPDDSHAPITYPFALTAQAQASARELLAFLEGSDATAIYQRFGFSVGK